MLCDRNCGLGRRQPNAGLQAALSDKQASYDLLQANYTALNGQYGNLQLVHSNLNQSYAALNESYSQLLQNNTSLQISLNEIQAQYADLNDIVNMNKEIVLATNENIYMGSVPVYQTSYNLSYPGFLQFNISAAQFGGVLECLVTNETLLSSQLQQGIFDPNNLNFELSGGMYLYMGTGPLNKTFTLPVMPGANNLIIVYGGESVTSTTLIVSIKYVY
jgi:prefoldin subunit 5